MIPTDIKFGDIKYFTLLRLQEQVGSRDFSKLGLDNLDKLRNEVHIVVQAIHLQEKIRKGEIKPDETAYHSQHNQK